MKTRIVSWGKNGQQEKVLLAIQLLEDESMVESFVFPHVSVTEDFEKQLRGSWKSGQDILFPEHSHHKNKLSITSPILPEDMVLEEQDLLNRMRTEWNFIVLSNRLRKSFDDELKEIKEHVENMQDFDNTLWNNLKDFWGKVQFQAREKNLFREHADKIKEETNELFGKLKEIRNKSNKEFAEESEKIKKQFQTKLDQIEAKIEEGLSLHPIFNELKDIQSKFKESKMTRKDRDNTWDRLDGLFKKIKEIRFGKPENGNPAGQEKTDRRLDGLMGAMDRMSKSISRDEQELHYTQNRSHANQNQLELQLKEAKIEMIKQRIASKKLKLDDMEKTKAMLEKKAEKLKKQRAQEKAKEEIKSKIAQDIKEHHEAVAENPKLVQSIETVVAQKDESSDSDKKNQSTPKDPEVRTHLKSVAKSAGILFNM